MRLGWLALLVAGCVATGRPAPAPGPFEDVMRVVGALDDVAGEYPNAISDEVQMRVLRRLLHDAERYAASFPEAERADLRTIAASVEARVPPPGVVAAARRLRTGLLAAHQVVLAPASPPSRDRAEVQWRSLCAGCHGTVGAGDGEQGLYLEPPPKDFHDPEFMAALAPSRAFHRIAEGVPGTAMPQWGLFSRSERWGLAFLVFGFRQDPEAAARGRVLVARTRLDAAVALSDRTDGELEDALSRAGLDGAEAADALAYLRRDAPFEAPRGAVPAALAAAVEAARARRDPEARAHVARARNLLARQIDAVRAADPGRADRLEHDLVGIEAQIVAGRMIENIERDVVRLDAALAHEAAPSLVGGARLALTWAAFAALALGAALARPQRGSRSRWHAPVLGLVLGGAIGAGFAPGTSAAGFAAGGLAIAGTLALAAPGAWRVVTVRVAAAALIGLALGVELRAVAIAPWLAGAGALAAVAIVGWLAAARRAAHATVVEAVGLAVAVAAAAGRAAWVLVAAADRPTPPLIGWRVDVLGCYPVRAAVVAAAVAAGTTLLLAIWRRRTNCAIPEVDRRQVAGLHAGT